MNTKSTIIAALLVAAIAAIAFVPANGSDAVEIPAEDVQIDYYAEAKWLDISLPSEYADTYKYTITGDDGSSLEDEVAIIDKGDSARGSIEGIVLDTSNVYYTIELTGVTHSDNTAVANFGAVTVTIVQPDNGQIVVMNGENQVNDGDKVAFGTTLTVTVTADDGYQVVGETSYTLIVNGDVTVAADIQPVPVTYTIASNDAAWGTVSVEEVTVTAGTEPAFDGATVTIGGTVVTATPADADEQYTYSFVEWNVDGTTITAVFEQTAIVYDVTVAPAENGTVTATPTAGAFGEEVTITMTPSQGYVLGELTINDVPVTDGIDEADGVYTYVTEIAGDMTVSATFVEPADPDREFSNQIILADGAVIDEKSSIDASYTQEVLVTGDVKVIAGGEIFINGKLTIQDGASLEIVSGGKVIVDRTGLVDVQGDLVAEAGTDGATFQYGGCMMTVAGTVILEGADSFATTSTATGIEVSGLFEVGEEATAEIDGMTVAEGGELLVYGVVTGTVDNAGTITVDSQGLDSDNVTMMYVEIKATGTVDIVNVYGIVLVSDKDLTFDASKAEKDKDAVYDNAVCLENVAGVTVTEKLVIEKNENGETVGTNTMYVAGSVAVADNYDSSAVEGYIAFIGGNVEVSETLALGEDVMADVCGSLKVSGEVSALEPAVTENGVTYTQIYLEGGEITVTGKITTNGGILGEGVINAAYYATERTVSVPAYTVYTTLNTALADGATGIALSGDNELTADATIPVGTTVDMDAGATLTVEKDVTLTIASDDRKSGKLNSTEADSVIVDGTIVAQNYGKSGIRDGSVESHTYKDVENARTYTNIYNALDNAADGETVKVSYGKALTIEQDVEIRSGVTLLIPAGENVTVDNGVTVTVNGTLVSQGAYVISPEIDDNEDTADVNEYKAAGATVVNGMMLYDDGNYTSDIVGAYFEYTYEKAVMNAIAPLASLPAIADDIKSDVYLYGKMSLGDIDFSAYDGEGALETIYAVNDLTIGSLTLGNVVFDASAAGAVVNGTIVLANGTVELDNVYGIIAKNVTDNVEDTVTSEISGKILAYDDPETENVTETGAVSVTGTVVATDGFVLGNVVGQDEKQTVSMDVPAGATLVAKAGTFNAGVTVEGTVTVAGANVAFAQLAVTGTVAADGKYIATVKELYVGVTADDLAMAGVGSVDGVTLANDAGSVAYVSPNATVGEDIVKNLKSTEYYAEDALYLTAYANNGNTVAIYIPFTVDSAYFAGWQYENKEGKMVDIDKDNDMVGKYDAVYADIVYDIYYVTVTADAGIGTVAVDGIVLVNQGGNVFVLTTPLSAGQHTVSYTLKSGYQGEAKLTVSSEGVTVSGMDFTLSGNQDNLSKVTVSLSLAGTEPGQTTVVVDNGGDSGMGLTDYLLIILVILIVVMAVIVALRMMRS